MNDLDIENLIKGFQTTMIGAIYEFEKSFGNLWGHHKPDNMPLTISEEKFLDLWELTRNRILNNGNHQLRKTIGSIGHKSLKYKYKFNNINKENKNDI